MSLATYNEWFQPTTPLRGGSLAALGAAEPVVRPIR
jgi:hypothetical protein